MWSAMSMRVPGLNVRRMPPAALVNRTVRMPTSAAVRMAERAGVGVVSLVHVEAATLGEDIATGELAEDEFALVAVDGGDGEAGDVAVGEAGWAVEMVGEVAEAAAEDDERGGLAGAEKIADGGVQRSLGRSGWTARPSPDGAARAALHPSRHTLALPMQRYQPPHPRSDGAGRGAEPPVPPQEPPVPPHAVSQAAPRGWRT